MKASITSAVSYGVFFAKFLMSSPALLAASELPLKDVNRANSILSMSIAAFTPKPPIVNPPAVIAPAPTTAAFLRASSPPAIALSPPFAAWRAFSSNLSMLVFTACMFLLARSCALMIIFSKLSVMVIIFYILKPPLCF